MIMTTRRDFMKRAAGGVFGVCTAQLAAGRFPSAFARTPGEVMEHERFSAGAPGRGPRSLRILILGGTGFLGPHQVTRAVERGHRVSVFNRGRRQADLPGSVEHLRGDREGGLDALRGGRWDVVIDNSANLPRWVRDSASLLRDSADLYIFVSTISVYADHATPGADESAPLATYGGPDPMAETLVTPQLYGPLKALAEAEAERWFPGRATIIRPGLIVGPGDTTDRFTYWPVRLARGGDVLAPGTPEDPVQIVDARDLAAWMVRVAEERTTGVFNAAGPADTLTMGEMFRQIADFTGSEPSLTWVDADFLAAEGVREWVDMPAWVPPRGDSAGFMRRSNRRAVEAGLTFRAIGETGRDTLAWFRSLPADRQANLGAGLSAEREAEVLRRWRESNRSRP
jgi:2'-hydroxyisoflavone reductase